MSRPDVGPGPKRVGDDLDDVEDRVREELDFYLERRVRELMDEGLAEDEARERARQLFGDVDGIRERCVRIQRRRRRRLGRQRLLAAWFRDLGFAVRALARRPGYALLAVTTLGLGIGANTAIFSAVNAVLLRPLPFPDSERLVQVWQTVPGGGQRSASPADYLDWRSGSRTFEQLASYDWQSRNLMGVDQPERLTLARVSGNFFATLGVEPVLGRSFGPGTLDQGDRVAVLGHGLWVRRFGADPAVVGGTIRLDDETYDVVGVMPRDFGFPAGAELWVGAAHDVPGIRNYPGDITALRDAWYFRVVGRLAPGVDLAAAQADMSAVAARLAETYPDSNEGTGASLVPLHEQTVASARPTLLLLLGAVGLVLLIACANVANLLLVRASGRRRELAVRRALGCGRRGIVRHVLAESAVLGGAGGLTGFALAMGGVRLVGPGLAGVIPRGGEVSMSGTVFLYSLLVAGVTALAFGGLPAWLASGTDPAGVTATRTASASGGRGPRRLHGLLVGAEVALAFLLVLTTSLVLRSVWNLHDVDLGFEPRGLVTLWLSLPEAREMSVAQRADFYGSVQEAITGLQGVASAGWAQTGPLSTGSGAGLRVRERSRDNLPGVSWQMVTPTYFDALGVRVLEGRGFGPQDTWMSERVTLVSETLARQIFPGEDPLGRLINTGLDGQDDAGEWNWVRVVGVVSDTRNRGPSQASAPMMYRPFAQGSGFFRGEAMMLVARTEPGAGDMVARIREVIRGFHGQAPVYGVATGQDLATRLVAGPRLTLTLLGSFAALALLLGTVGIYGVTAFAVSRRTGEIGVRMAVGAGRNEVVGLVLRQGLTPSMVGVGVGLGLALSAAGSLRAFLFQVSPTDVTTYVAVAGVLILVAAGATWLPARRAASVDPVRAMRAE